MSLLNLLPYIISNKGTFTSDVIKCLKQKVFYTRYINQRFSSQTLHESIQIKSNTYVPFLQVIKAKKLQANRSILVQVQSAQSYKELHAYCNTIGTVKHMLHYSSGVEPMHFIIVEFAKESDVENILCASTHVDGAHIVPVHSTFLWFKASSKRLGKLKASRTAKLGIENGTQIAKDCDVKEYLQNSKSISEQMIRLYELTKLNDVGTRLRFLVAKQIETALAGMFPNATAFPFGSSVNGYGKMGCDLDLLLKLNGESEAVDESRLVFHCKAQTLSDRFTSQRHMEAIGDLLHLFLPGCSQVRKILQARVPIIKYYQQLADVECDLSMLNMSGVYMSDFLFIMGSIDRRVCPLVFTIRKWAYEVGLTNSSPGRWITNFSLTLLVLAFLQRPGMLSPVLPTLNSLVKSAGPADKYIMEDGTNCSFLRDVNNLNFKSTNEESLGSLLQQFFAYYSQFDFATKAVCLNEGIPITKPEHSALYIVNPLERGLNVSKNVSLEELEKFKIEARNAAWTLESQENKTTNWGILSIFDNKRRNGNYSPMPRQGKLLEVSKLFENESEGNTLNIEFKNDDVKKQVEHIKNETFIQIKQIENNDKKITKLTKRKSRS